MNELFKIHIVQTDSGFNFQFEQESLKKLITCAGSEEALLVRESSLAEKLKKSIESNATWFDEDDNLIISSPLYFMLSLNQSGTNWLLDHVENWPIFWSADPFYHRHTSSLAESAPVVSFLKSAGLQTENLPDADYDNWEDLHEEHFLPEKMTSKLTDYLLTLEGKKRLAAFYFAFNSPHVTAGLAWTNGLFPDNSAFVSYSLLAENFIGKEKEKTAEIYYRLEQLTEIRDFLDN
jgi:hypothetical protein